MDNDEVARRRNIADAADPQFLPWSDPRSLHAVWDGRAKRAATYIPAGSRVLDLGCGAMALERYLAEGCTYQPCDLVARDARTLVCDFNEGEFPVGFDCDVVSVLGVLEYVADVPAFLAKVRALNCPVVLSYSASDRPGYATRAPWVNAYTQAEFIAVCAAAGFSHYVGAPIKNAQILLRLEPDPVAPQPTEDAQAAMLRLAAGMIPAYSRVLGIGPDSRALEALLPIGCAYESADTVPAETMADIVVLLRSDDALAAAARSLGQPLVCAWPATGLDAPDLVALGETMKGAGFRLQCAEQATPALCLLKFVPEPYAAEAPGTTKRVLVLSYYNIANFGDRLGYHVLNSVLPADAEVTYGTLHPWSVPDRDFDLLILGIGNSLMARDALMPELDALIDRIPHAIGIFGTHFRDQFLPPERAAALDTLLGKLTTWWARYEEDILAFGRGRANVRHLGDWLIAAFPMAVPTQDKGLTIPAEILGQEVPLDRTIQRIQAYRAVSSARLHTLLCALTSADHVLYQEQRVSDDPTKESGKFRSMLVDIFGRTFEEGQLFAVDRDAVIRYKKKVEANLADLREELSSLLE
ncbi:MAG TPA: hypothetical protein VK533_13940 [Sphingomonas sp.]|uniref:class I SAM-dependent methyltransferase n=1 Tax=Sphingomonas sp. TaxID=28214 RepID=UPI002BCF5ED4|nr:hypothetical protein [Sphingomonas sp.]HMI20635.1 hypothetical protein [Sphingomonas sp.]